MRISWHDTSESAIIQHLSIHQFLPLVSTLYKHLQEIETCSEPGLGDYNLVRRIRRGEYSAFEELFNDHYEDLVRYAGLRIPSKDVAEGLVQDIVVRIWERRDTWNPQGALRAYLYAMVRNACIAYDRKQRRRSRLFNTWITGRNEVGDSPDNRYQVEEMNFAAQQAIEAMPGRRREIFCLSRQYGLTYKEIAAMLDISTKTVEAQMGSALRYLRERLKPYL